MADAPARIPVTVVGGYLGAGKTTLVNHLLRSAQGLRLAVLVNDFGALPIDADLIEAQDGNVIGIAGGCVCCSYGSDLMQALIDLAARTPRPEHVLLETSGVALPGPVAAALTLLQDYVLDSVLTLADAAQVCTLGHDRYLADTIGRQLQDAHLILLNKADLAAPETLAQAQRWLGEVAPGARILTTRHAAVPIEVVLGHRLGNGPAAQPHGRSHAPHGTAYTTDVIDPGPVPDASTLAQALCDPALGILRAKGVVVQKDGTPWLVQVVGAHASAMPAAGRIALSRGLVVIGLSARLDLPAVRLRIAAG